MLYLKYLIRQMEDRNKGHEYETAFQLLQKHQYRDFPIVRSRL